MLNELSLDQLEKIQTDLKGVTGHTIGAWLEVRRKNELNNVLTLSTGKAEDTVLREQKIGAALILGQNILNEFTSSLDIAIQDKRSHKQI